MPGRRVEERVKSNEAPKETGVSQQPSNGRAQGRAGTRRAQHRTEAPERGAPEGQEKSGTAQHDTHRTDTTHTAHTHTRAHSTWPASPGSPPSGLAAGGGGASDPICPSQRQTATPPGTPYRHPHSEQRQPARAHAVAPVQGPHARTDRTRDTRVAEPWLPAPEDGRPGGGTAPDTRRPSHGWLATPPGDGPRPSPRQAAPTGHAGQGDSVGPPHPHTRTHSTWVADPNSPPSGRAVGGGTAPDLRRPSQW